MFAFLDKLNFLLSDGFIKQRAPCKETVRLILDTLHLRAGATLSDLVPKSFEPLACIPRIFSITMLLPICCSSAVFCK